MASAGVLIASLAVAVWLTLGPYAVVRAAPATGAAASSGGQPPGGGAAAGDAVSPGQLPGAAGPVTPAPRTPAPPVAPTGLLQVDQIAVQVHGSPAHVAVRVQGMILDGCTSLGPVSQQRQGGAVTVTVPTVTSGATVCTQMARVVDLTVRLAGEFPAGTYRVQVNGVEKPFQVGP